MTNWLSDRIDKIYKLDAYVKPERIKDSIKLDANENFALDSEFISKIALDAIKQTDLREYPFEQFEDVYRQLSNYSGVDKKYLGIGSGSDQIIELILSIFGRNQRASIFTPTFSYFINRCELHDIALDRVPLTREAELPKLELLKRASRSDIIYICSPNNPTGNQFGEKIVLEIIDLLKDKLILIDEAYVEFGNYNLAPYIAKYDNVVILRTLSKAFGLAGARIGYLIANEKFAEIFRTTIQSPYPLNSFSLAVGTLVLSNELYVRQTVELIKRERKRVFDELFKMKGIKVFRSDANFIFLESYDSYGRILSVLKKDGLSVKAFGDIDGLRGCIRVTIGTSEMNDKFLRSISKAI
ncbi:MAG TPA: aminotransferase class I/II-fold pyridoxal phosphate-dependent enzyme [Candidatus Nitrosopolaris sp.]|nr:aminotransferase class I/II-fold pyridoxal phosphate-dependent enzyme [Candidatus Nitrosopolaris sp.]